MDVITYPCCKGGGGADCNPVEYYWYELEHPVSRMGGPWRNLIKLRPAFLDEWAESVMREVKKYHQSDPHAKHRLENRPTLEEHHQREVSIRHSAF